MAFDSKFENNQLKVAVENRLTIFDVKDFMALIEPKASDLSGLSLEFVEDVKVDTASIQLFTMLSKWLESKGGAIELTGKTRSVSDIFGLLNLNFANVSVETSGDSDE